MTDLPVEHHLHVVPHIRIPVLVDGETGAGVEQLDVHDSNLTRQSYFQTKVLVSQHHYLFNCLFYETSSIGKHNSNFVCCFPKFCTFAVDILNIHSLVREDRNKF